MNYNIGDLVTCRSHGEKIGLIVDKRISNEGVSFSMHTRHVLNLYPSVYYIFFSGEGKTGPYLESELKLYHSI